MTLAGGAAAAIGLAGRILYRKTRYQAATFIASVDGYEDSLRRHLLDGFQELGLTKGEIRGRRVLLKPNLVEPHLRAGHINTHPLVVRAAIEAFFHMGAATVTVAEGSGHRLDTFLVLEESGFAQVLYEDKVPFRD